MRSTSYGKLWNYLLPSLQAREAQWTYQTGIWEIGSMILLGMALLKFGFFSSRFSAKQYLLLALITLTAGILAGWFRLHYNQHALHDYAKYVVHHRLPFNFFFPIECALMALGYASLVLFLMKGLLFKQIWRTLGLAGQMALTNYLLQSIICALYFTGFGMGYFGRLKQYQLYVVAAEICLVQTILSVLWLRYYHHGPAEWLWRSLIYKKWLPNKIQKTGINEPTISVETI